jgi:hypothetical protein
VRTDNQVLFDRQATDIAAIADRQTEQKAAADADLDAVRQKVESTAKAFAERLGGVEADLSARLELTAGEAAKSRERLREDIEDIRVRLEDHGARHEKAESGLRLHEKSIDEVRQVMIGFWMTTFCFGVYIVNKSVSSNFFRENVHVHESSFRGGI